MKRLLSGMAIGGLLLYCAGRAQSAQAPAGNSESMPASAQQVIERLGQLNRLPDDNGGFIPAICRMARARIWTIRGGQR